MKMKGKSSNKSVEGPNWILIAGGALLSTLSIRLGYKLKQAVDGTDASKQSQNHHRDRDLKDSQQQEMMIPYSPAENGVVWASSPDRLELPSKPFDSPSASESGSDVFFTKRDVVLKLRQQLKRRDDMISEMQDRIAELQASLGAQLARSAHLESQLDGANRDLFDSEREIQRLRKAIADHCVGGARQVGEGERVEMLRREVGELREVLQGKDYLLHSYKEQKAELSLKIADLQSRLDSYDLLNTS